MALRKSIVAGLLLAGATLAGQASAITFNLIDQGGTAPGTQARQGFEIAAAYWSSVLTNSNVTINLNIGFSQLGANILGQTGSTKSVNFNSQVYGALASHVTSTLDASAVAHLQTLQATPSYGVNGITMTTNALNAAGTGYLDTSTRVDSDGSINNVATVVNTTLDKALGITTDANGATINYALADGTVKFSNQYTFDFNPSDGITAGSIDFIGVAIHEIGHALGFVSGVDTYDAYTAPGATATRTGALEGSVVGTVLDSFRYSAAGRLDWSTQNTPYFSIDGGVTQFNGDGKFAQGTLNGDGSQASHWKDEGGCDVQIGIMDPNFCYGQMGDITANDLAAFDAIGWKVGIDVLANPNYNFTTGDAYRAFANAGVPEASTWAMMIVGFGLVGAASRRRSSMRMVQAI